MVAKLCILRYQGSYSEDEIAEQLGFTPGYQPSAAKAMYKHLEDLGLPPWLVYGEEPRANDKPKREARSTGDTIKLPPAGVARELFREVVQELSRYVDTPEPPKDRPAGFMDIRYSESVLDTLEEYLQAERFITADVYRPDPEFMQVVRREDLSAEEWKRACGEYGEDPDQDHFWMDAETGIYPHGAMRFPSEPLVQLIGAYVLVGKPLEPLLEKLHPRPEAVDREQLERLIHGHKAKRYIPGMLYKVKQVARAVRGGTIREGPPAGELSQMDLLTAWRVSFFKQRGLSYTEIHEAVKKDGYSLEDVQRFADMNPTKPD